MSPFPFETYAERTAIAQAKLARYGRLTMLTLAQEPYFFLFGYDGGGYVFCQCAVLTTEGESVTVLCRRPDVVQAQDTSTVDDIRVSLNAKDANPTRQLWEILIEGELTGSTVRIEMENHGHTGATFTAIAVTLKWVCKHVDGSKMVRRQRIVKSPEELDYMPKAASLTAAAMTVMLEGDGGMPPAGPLVSSGRSQEEVMMELTGNFRPYNGCIERVVVIGTPPGEQRSMDRLVEAFLLREPLGRFYKIHRSMLDARWFGGHRYAACGYPLGATYRPSWMDVPPMIYASYTTEIVLTWCFSHISYPRPVIPD